jgi:Holliday junction resolvasome RuvABC ATP-dependent DNA helicase subunit
MNRRNPRLADVARDACQEFGVDDRGIDATDRAYLGILADAGQPVGLGTVAAVLGEEEANVSEVVESYLLRAGLIVKGLGVGHSPRPGGSTTSLEASET